jgi:hypothetical protein
MYFVELTRKWVFALGPVMAYIIAFKFSQWIVSSKKSRDKNEKLIKATTSLKNNQIHGNALILRAIDDEASLALAAGTIANLLSTHMISISTIFIILVAVIDVVASYLLTGYSDSLTRLLTIPQIEFVGLVALWLALLVAIISRSVHGRELLYNPPGIQMNVQSVPDFIRSAEIRTLLRGDVGVYFSLRHGIYSHPDASAVIADWISADARWADSQPFDKTPDVTSVCDHGSQLCPR